MDWQPISTAPMNSEWVEVKLKGGAVYVAHYASDLSGEEQSPFEGWFTGMYDPFFRQIAEPEMWRPYVKPTKDKDLKPQRVAAEI